MKLPIAPIKKLILKVTAISMLTFLSACAAPINDSCGWLKPIQPDEGFQTRWTRAEKVQVDALDKNIDKNCRN